MIQLLIFLSVGILSLFTIKFTDLNDGVFNCFLYEKGINLFIEEQQFLQIILNKHFF